MAVISYASTKGGVGKTTAAAIAVSILSDAGVSLCVIDADPNQSLRRWAESSDLGQNVQIHGILNEDELLDQIEAAASENQFVLVDLEGSMNVALSDAIAASNLVIIPVQASQLDAEEAVKVLKLVEKQKRLTKRNIDVALLWQKSPPAIVTRTEKHIREQFLAGNVTSLNTRIVDREAFKAMFTFSSTLGNLTPDQVSDPIKAKLNAIDYVNELIEHVKGLEV